MNGPSGAFDVFTADMARHYEDVLLEYDGYNREFVTGLLNEFIGRTNDGMAGLGKDLKAKFEWAASERLKAHLAGTKLRR
jgi:hypothetical protein